LHRSKKAAPEPLPRRLAILNSYAGIGCAYILAKIIAKKTMSGAHDGVVAAVAFLAPAIQGAQHGAQGIDRVEVHVEAP